MVEQTLGFIPTRAGEDFISDRLEVSPDIPQNPLFVVYE